MDKDKILLAHGSGGRLTYKLIKELFLERFNNPVLKRLDDSAVFHIQEGKLAFTTDSYVVTPIFFKGGDIGKLAICGTVNDLSMSGATPLYLVTSLIMEEGFPITHLKRIIDSMSEAAESAGIKIIGGDTKVVGKGSADKIFITTSGIGVVPPGIDISSVNAKVSDLIILSGGIGEHGISILQEREGLDFKVGINSDCAPLNGLVADVLKASKNVHVLRDLTRGGLAAALNEIAIQSEVGVVIEEEKILIKEGVKGACELLGLDPLYVACEGRFVAILPKEDAHVVLEAMRKNVYGKDATLIGEIVDESPKVVRLHTEIGGERIVDMMLGEQLPRIC